MPKDSRARRLLALATDTWPARGYWALMAGSVAAAIAAPDSALAQAHVLLTAPLSTMAIFVPVGPGTEGGGAVEALAVGGFAGWLLLSALLNAAALGALTHHVRESRAARHA
ncbi:SCO4225 family membrane protein [Streptomyces sp. NPDC000983]|uniref:SCO4225 family membrane protein n=1 Tax=Streptomyces sp. NPDC000983 TaxID=3154373 RepID=UPI00331DC485